ncbi:MAG: M67 family metallopeptidase [Chloroflexi bacterium]|nr:M67 family metallopeptidase [Chloroflexota bacterium]
MAYSIPFPVARQIADHALAESPLEACGLLAGTDGHIGAAFPIRNVAQAANKRYELDPKDQLLALKAIDDGRLEWIGVYHSHPQSAPIPSTADVNEWADSGLLQLIVSLERSIPQLKLWRLGETSVCPVDLVYVTAKLPEHEPDLTRSQQAALLIVILAAVLMLLIIAFTLLPPAPEIAPASR